MFPSSTASLPVSRVPLVGSVAAAFVFASLASRGLALALDLHIPLTPGLVVGLALLAGPVVAWGAGLGVVLTDLVTGTLGRPTLVSYLGQFLLVGLALGLWGTFGRLSCGDDPGTRDPRNALEFGLVATTAGSLFAAATAWGTHLVGVAPFASTVGGVLERTVASAVLVGGVVLYVVPAVAERTARSWPSVDGASPIPSRPRLPVGAPVLLVAVAWVVAGIGVDRLLQAIELERATLLAHRVGQTTVGLLDLAGSNGSRAQALLGVVSLSICLGLLHHAESTVEEG